MQAPTGTRITFKESKRNSDQNAKFWALATEIALQVEWHGQKLTADEWKLVLLAGLNKEMRLVPNIDGDGYVNLGRSSSNLSKGEFSALIELALAFGAQHGVHFKGDNREEESEEAQNSTAANP